MKPQVFYPSKTLDRAEIGVYSVVLRKLGRLENEHDTWYIEVQKNYTRVVNCMFDSVDRALEAFSYVKERCMVQTAADVFNVAQGAIIINFDVTQATPLA
jgi:hypothetical protein